MSGAGSACPSAVTVNDGGRTYQIIQTGIGVCDVTVKFRDGSTYSDTVHVAMPCTEGACCARCGGFPDHEVDVPSIDAGFVPDWLNGSSKDAGVGPDR